MRSAFGDQPDVVEPSKDVFTKWHCINNGWFPHMWEGRVYWVFDQCFHRCVLFRERTGLTPKTAGRSEHCRKCMFNICNPITTVDKKEVV